MTTTARASCWLGLTALLVVLAADHLSGQAAPPKPAPEPEAQPRPADPLEPQKLAYFRDRLGAVRLTVADRPDDPCQFVADPLIKFDNPISHIEDGLMFLWTDRGRPAATVKSYHNTPNKSWGRTFVSLATRPLEMREGDKVLWAPQQAGLSFAALPSGGKPAAEARQRLTQMRQIARRFQVIDNWGIKDPTDWTLRLLTTPLYRYEMPAEKVVDGAMFGYALTTSPEALVLIEARQTGEGLVWHYAVSRCTRFGVRFALDGEQIADFPRLNGWPPTQTYFHYPVPWVEYPFLKKNAPAEGQ
jgi:hypothetical protein